jgi:hypothetical protein
VAVYVAAMWAYLHTGVSGTGKTEIVANHVEMLSGRRKKDHEAESAANALATQASVYGDEADIAAGAALRPPRASARRVIVSRRPVGQPGMA